METDQAYNEEGQRKKDLRHGDYLRLPQCAFVVVVVFFFTDFYIVLVSTNIKSLIFCRFIVISLKVRNQNHVL